MPMGVWSTSSTRSICSAPCNRRAEQRLAATCASRGKRARAAPDAARRSASVDLPEPETPVRAIRRPSGSSTSRSSQVVQRRALHAQHGRGTRAARAPRARRGMSRVPQWLAQAAAGDRVGLAHQICATVPLPTTRPPRCRRRAQVEHMIGATDGFLVVLHHHQRVAAPAQLAQAHRAAGGCRADAGRWWARPAHSRRRAGSSPAARPAAGAASRRRRAWAPRDPAPGRRAPRARRNCQPAV